MNIQQNSVNAGPDEHGDLRRSVYSCMETGNFDTAVTLMAEYKEQFPAEAEALRLQIVRDYGKDI